MTNLGYLLPLLVALPLLAGVVAHVVTRIGPALGISISFANLALAIALALGVMSNGAIQQNMGHWSPPLGIALRADGPAAVMILMSTLVVAAISCYSGSYFSSSPRARHGFWPLWLFLSASLHALFLSRDLFNLYVTLELMSVAAVALTALAGERVALSAAMRYLLASLAGSLIYLLGVAITYHGAGSVDIAIVAREFGSSSGLGQTAALALMTAGLMLKGALFPLHFWLPAAHASAAAPVSAALSALVVKAAFFVLLRLWLEAFATAAHSLYGVLALLGGAGVLWGSLQAMVQVRAKLLIAYSTVAQVGYLFLAMSLVNRDPTVWAVVMLFAFAHALAKASMFLAVGNLQSYAGHDRIADLDLVVQRMPMSVAALALAGVSIMGLPPSGGFNAKWMLLESAILQGRWWVVAVLLLGGLLAAIYLFKLIEQAFTGGQDGGDSARVSFSRELSALILALLAVGLGFLSIPLMRLLSIGSALPWAGPAA